MAHDEALDPESDLDEPSIVRPYALTSGRTKSDLVLPIEATVEVLPKARDKDWGHGDRSADIVERCAANPSIAELSAGLNLALGVTRVLVGDLITAGYLSVRGTLSETATIDERHDLIERTLRGLRAL